MSAHVQTPLTTALGDGIIQIRLPMEGNPLRHINGYLIEDDDGLSLIDCGWKADDVLAALHAGLAEAGYTLGALRRLFITHFHFDHYGLAGTLLRAGVPELLMHEIDWAFAREHLIDPVAMDATADAWIARNGLTVDASLEEEMHHHRIELAQPTRFIADGERVGRLTAIATPGHSPGHLCYLDARSGKMFTGDHVLDPVTPHVGVWRDGRGDPLGEYTRSLVKVAEIDARGVLPAHGEPFPDLRARVAALQAHQAEREAHILIALRAHPSTPASATDIARALPWTRREKKLTDLTETHQQFAVAETLAHLEHLRARGVVTRDLAADPIVYRLSPEEKS